MKKLNYKKLYLVLVYLVICIQFMLPVLHLVMVVEKDLKWSGRDFFLKSFLKILLFLVRNLIKIKFNFNTTLQATSTWKIDQFEGVIRSTKCTIMTANLSGLCSECVNLKKKSRLKDALKAVSLLSLVFIC